MYYLMNLCKVKDFQFLANNNIVLLNKKNDLEVIFDIIHTSKLRCIDCKLHEDKQTANLVLTTNNNARQCFSIDVSTPEEAENLKHFITRLEFMIYNNII